MPKITQKHNVLDAARERIAWTFDHFEKIYVSFSGGKDSTVMLHLAVDEARKRNRMLGVLFVDLEGQYQMTIEHIRICVEMYRDVCEVYWVCLPIHLRNAVSVYETHWICWEDSKQAAWVRTPPDDGVTDPARFPFFRHGMEFEEFVPEFGEWYAGGSTCACMVGQAMDDEGYVERF